MPPTSSPSNARPNQPHSSDTLSIGEVAERTGLAVSAIRFYADEGLIPAQRTAAGHRRFERSVLRRISFIQVSQRLGYTLTAITELLDQLPSSRTPTKADWGDLALGFGQDLDDRIAQLQLLRDTLDACIGCGCLSLEACALYNPADGASELGTGPRYLLGNSSGDVIDLSADDPQL